MVHPQNDFSNAKVGDKVYCLINGEGVISKIIGNGTYPIRVSFDEGNSRDCYTRIGKIFDTTSHPSLYHSKPEIIPAKGLIVKELKGFITFVKRDSEEAKEPIFHFAMDTRYNSCSNEDERNIAATITYTVSE